MKLQLEPGTDIISTHPIRTGEKGAAAIPATTKGKIIRALGDNAYYCEFVMDERGIRKVLATVFESSIRP